jgi:tRNA threonylcarbamoyladenosine biosynthesis protein TsaE
MIAAGEHQIADLHAMKLFAEAVAETVVPQTASDPRARQETSPASPATGSISSHGAVTGPRHIVLLDGPMGAGKTQFTRFFMKALGSNETVSPSFAIHNSYETPVGTVEHFDLYRLENEDDLESTGFWDYFLNRKGIIVIEWASRLREAGLEAALPRTWPKIWIAIELSSKQRDARCVRVRFDS